MELCKPFAAELLQAVNSTTQSTQQVKESLAGITSILRHTKKPLETDQKHPFEKILSELWPVLEKLLTKFNSKEVVVEEILRIYKHSLK